MSFLKKNFWMPREAGYTDGEMSYDNSSRTEPKRAHQWLLDASEPELLCNKKQAVEAANSRPMSGSSNVDISLWENTSKFQSGSGLFPDHLFGPEPVRTSNLSGKKISSVVGAGDSNMERSGFEDQVQNTSQVGLSVSHAMGDPSSCLNYGFTNVNVNHIKDSDKGMPVSMEHSYCGGDNNTISLSTTKSDDVSLGPTCNYFVGNTFNKADKSFTLMGQTINKGDGSSMFMGRSNRKEDDSILSMRQPLLKGNGNFVLVDHQYVKGDDNIISMPSAYNRRHDNLFAMGTTYNKANDNFIAMGPNFDKGDDNIIPVGPTRDTRDYNIIPMGATHDKVNTSVVLMGTAYEKGPSSIASMGPSYKRGEGTAISFVDSQDGPEANNHSGRVISSYDLFRNQASEVLGWKDSLEHSADPNVTVAPAATSKTDVTGKNKEKKKPKKNPSNSFPSNVKSLLSTGILDGVPVKYTSWARDKNLRGIIKEGAYFCGCNDCKLSKALNAYEFERHAGCKTKHPNNHIYFENGKSVYAVVQELQNTPKEMLFEAIQSVTGSPVNQKNFSTWKASYEAATRELQRIYGKDGVVILS